ncbi:MAG: hypothetical protein ABJH07_19870 [Sedimentitalea sp.]|uniref:hypothetical protein n=1 Tax=Sedimentitalea sp. TaxID=2048915 RepID=UPI0032669CE8
MNFASAIETPFRESPDAPSIIDLGSAYYLDGYFVFLVADNTVLATRELALWGTWKRSVHLCSAAWWR